MVTGRVMSKRRRVGTGDKGRAKTATGGGGFVAMVWVLIGITSGLSGCSATRQTTSQAKTQTVTIHGHVFHLELALTDAARYQGLSDRKHIAKDGGMLFVFKKPQFLTFVMRRCYVPIDLIYLDADGRVVSTYRMKVQPYDTPEDQLVDYSSDYPAQFAIELKGGMLNKLHLAPAARIDLPLVRLKARAR